MNSEIPKLYPKLNKPSLEPREYIELVTELFLEKADPFRAERQMAYMRNQFEYCGLGASVWYPMTKEIFREHGMYTGKKLKEFVEGCYDQSYREVMYVGIEMMQRILPQQTASWIKVLEKCIITHSWWDSVDWLAKLVGIHFKNFPDLQHEYAFRWIESENIWLQRVAIIHQLFYRETTDEKLLFDMIRMRADSTDFFIRKACGWALRQYAKTNPKSVERFLAKTKVSNLTLKEAWKQLDKNN